MFSKTRRTQKKKNYLKNFCVLRVFVVNLQFPAFVITADFCCSSPPDLLISAYDFSFANYRSTHLRALLFLRVLPKTSSTAVPHRAEQSGVYK